MPSTADKTHSMSAKCFIKISDILAVIWSQVKSNTYVRYGSNYFECFAILGQIKLTQWNIHTRINY